MAEPVYIDNSTGIAGLIFVPPLVPLGYAIYKTWLALSAYGVHDVFKLAAGGAEMVAVFYALRLMYRRLPPLVSTGLTAAYVAATYGWVATLFLSDPIWIGAIAAITGVGGYFVGRSIAREERSLITS